MQSRKHWIGDTLNEKKNQKKKKRKEKKLDSKPDRINVMRWQAAKYRAPRLAVDLQVKPRACNQDMAIQNRLSFLDSQAECRNIFFLFFQKEEEK